MNNQSSWESLSLVREMNKLDAALHYASMGVRVFPLTPNSKVPLLQGSWKEQATTDSLRIRKWWSQTPEANIAGVMGMSSGVIASDLDMKAGQDGWRSYQKIAPGQPQGPIAKTPSNGYHLLHQPLDGIINFTHKGDCRGIDFRGGDNGYIVLAPSTVNGRFYQWVQFEAPQPLPRAVADQYLRWSQERSINRDIERPEIEDVSTLKPLQDLRLPQRHLDFLIQGLVDDRFNGDRSAALLGAAGALYRVGCRDEEVLAYLESSYAMEVARDHRPRGDALGWIWDYVCLKARENRQPNAKEAFASVPFPSGTLTFSPVLNVPAFTLIPSTILTAQPGFTPFPRTVELRVIPSV